MRARTSGPGRPRRLPVLHHALAGLVLIAAAHAARASTIPAVFTGSALEDSVRNLRGPRFEDAFQELLACELEASAAHSREAAGLRGLLRRVAETETRVLGTRIGSDQLRTRAGWDDRACRERSEAWRWESRGWAARSRRDPHSSDSLLALAMPVYTKLGDRRREAWVAGRLAACAFDRGELDLAEARYGTALALRRSLGDSLMLGNTLSDLGGLLIQRHREPIAVVPLREASEIRERMHDARLGATLGLLATAHAVTGPADSAAALFERALTLPLASDRRRDLLLNHARFLIARGDRGRAESQVGEVRLAAEAAGDDRQVAIAIELLSGIALAQGRYTDALEREAEIETLLVARGDSSALMASRLRQASILASALDRPGAERMSGQVAATAETWADTALLARALVNRATARIDRSAAPRGREDALRALRLAETAGDSAATHDACYVLGQLATMLGRPQESLMWYTRALGALPVERDVRTAVDRLGVAAARLLLGQLDAAEPELRAIAALADSEKFLDVAAIARADLADLFWRRGETDRAAHMGRENLAHTEALRLAQRRGDSSIGLFADHQDEFESAIYFLVRAAQRSQDRAQLAEAFDWAERSRARALLDRRRASGTGRGQPLGLSDVQRHLGREEAIVEFMLGDSLGLVWVVRADTFAVAELPPRAAVRIKVSQARMLLGSASAHPGAQRAALDSLGRMLLQPVWGLLQGAARWVVVPDGPLAFLPFEPLRIGGSYVVGRHDISYTPSASLYLSPSPTEPTSRVVTLADPDFGGGGVVATGPLERGVELLPLPGSRAEAENLQRQVAAHLTTALLGARASRRELLAAPGLDRASIVHLATHGRASEIEPEQSVLWFAPDSAGGPPSRLSAAEIAGLDLGADLVTLAACESGLGELARGEGVLGFSRAFLAAGTHSVVASLWRISDTASAVFMRYFYAELLASGASRVEALCRAKRRMLAQPETGSPFQWGAFVLIGEDGPLRASRPMTPSRRPR